MGIHRQNGSGNAVAHPLRRDDEGRVVRHGRRPRSTGVTITNRSDTENLVMLKHFGPGNPDAKSLDQREQLDEQRTSRSVRGPTPSARTRNRPSISKQCATGWRNSASTASNSVRSSRIRIPTICPIEEPARRAAWIACSERGLAFSGIAANLWGEKLINTDDQSKYISEFRKQFRFRARSRDRRHSRRLRAAAHHPS